MKLFVLLKSSTLLVALAICSNITFAQLYSSGNNNISNDKVGVGINTPEATIHLKDYSGIGWNGFTNIPLLRFQATDPTLSPTTSNFWDFKMGLGANLTISRFSTQNPSPVDVLTLSNSYVQVLERLKVGSSGEYGTATTPNNTPGYVLSLGLMEYNPTGVWGGSGAALFATNSGEFQIMTNPSGTVNGTANMANQVRFSIDETNGYFSTPIRIGGAYADNNILQSGYFLYVKKGIRTEKVVVDYYNTWADYVFEKDYELRSLEDLKEYVMTNKHLPRVPAATEIAEQGIDLGEMNAILIEKVEELTLYLIDLEERLKEVENSKIK